MVKKKIAKYTFRFKNRMLPIFFFFDNTALILVKSTKYSTRLKANSGCYINYSLANLEKEENDLIMNAKNYESQYL